VGVPGELDQGEGIPGVEDRPRHLIARADAPQDVPDERRRAEVQEEAHQAEADDIPPDVPARQRRDNLVEGGAEQRPDRPVDRDGIVPIDQAEVEVELHIVRGGDIGVEAIGPERAPVDEIAEDILREEPWQRHQRQARADRGEADRAPTADDRLSAQIA
jgi:hypothetical protein